MKNCPKCGRRHNKNVTVCRSCGYCETEKPVVPKSEVRRLLRYYEYEKLPDGYYKITGAPKTPIFQYGEDMECRITVPDIVTAIGDHVFSGFKHVLVFELPNTLTSVGDGAFYFCRELTELRIPASVTHMGSGVFGSCYELKRIYCGAPSKPEGWAEDWLGECQAEVVWGS